MADGWGRRVTRSNGRFQIGLHDTSPCVRYVEQIFPRQARRSPLAREAGLDIVISLDVCGPGGGQWTCQWVQGELIHVKKGLQADVEVTYHTDTDSFQAIIEGRETPQQAFFEQKITLTGNLEAGLKLAYLFDRFLDENAHATHVERN